MKEFCTIIEKGVTIPKIINDYFNPFEPFWGRLNEIISDVKNCNDYLITKKM